MQLVNNNKDKTPLEKQGSGTAGTKVMTNVEGYAAFTTVPQGVDLRVQVLNAPAGATSTLKDKGDNKELDSDLHSSGFSDNFRINIAGDFTEIDLGYRLPTEVKIRVVRIIPRR